MVCSQCGEVIVDAKKPCPACGHMMTEQEDMDNLIKVILEEDDYTPKFEEVPSDNSKKEDNKPNISTIFNNGTKPSKDPKVVKDQSTVKQVTKPSKKPGAKPSAKAVTPTSKKKEAVSKHPLGDLVVKVLRYTLAAVIVLFFVSMFFNWFTLKENAVNYGMVRTEEVKAFMYPGLENYSEEQLGSFLKTSDVPIVIFSGMDLYKFGGSATQEYLTIKGPSGDDKTSMVAVVHKYYMLAMMIPMIVSFVSLVIVLAFKSLKGIDIVRNLTFLNLVVIGLNYLALKVPYFSMFAVKGKDLLGSALNLKPSEISMTMEGVVVKSLDTFYAYGFQQENGFIFALVMLGIWLLLGIVLTEVKHRREEIAIEEGIIK